MKPPALEHRWSIYGSFNHLVPAKWSDCGVSSHRIPLRRQTIPRRWNAESPFTVTCITSQDISSDARGGCGLMLLSWHTQSASFASSVRYECTLSPSHSLYHHYTVHGTNCRNKTFFIVLYPTERLTHVPRLEPHSLRHGFHIRSWLVWFHLTKFSW